MLDKLFTPLLGAAVLAACIGCAHPRGTVSGGAGGLTPPEQSAPEPMAGRPALRALAELAGHQQRAPVPVKDAPPPPGVSGLAPPPPPPPLTEAAELAEAPLAEVMAALSGEQGEGAGEREATPLKQLALRRYVSGREKLLRGDSAAALSELTAVTALDPGAPEPWLALADAHLTRGDRRQAAAAYRSALERGSKDARALQFVGQARLEAGDAAGAARSFVRAAGSRADPALRRLILVGLGRSLLAQGYLRAGREALVAGLSMADGSAFSARYVLDTQALALERGELWRDAGDAALRLGEHDRAIEAYRHAADADAGGSVTRLAYAAARAGRPAWAALYAVRRAAQPQGQIADDVLEAITYLARGAGLERQIIAALDEHARAEQPTPSMKGVLSRAMAAALPDERARRVLREHARSHPGNEAALRDLARLCPTAAGAAREMAWLVERRPFESARIAEAFMDAGHEPVVLVAALQNHSSAGGLLGARIEAALGRPAAAIARLEGMGTGKWESPASATRAEIALTLEHAGGVDVDAELARLAGDDRAGAIRARALALGALQRLNEAFELAARLAKGPHPDDAARLEDLLLAGGLAVARQDASAAEPLLREALELDPFDERVYTLLVGLYGPGPAHDQEKLNEVLQALVQASPNGRVLRLLRARELARRSLLDEAERDLLAAAEQDPANAEVLAFLVTVWERQAQQQPAGLATRLQLLGDLISRYPHRPVLVMAKARLLSSTGRHAEAEAMLGQYLGNASHPDLARLREDILRRHLDRAEEADAAAMARLELSPPSADRAIQLAELHARAGRDEQAAAAAGMLDPRCTLSAEQTTRVLVLTGTISARAAESGGTPGPALDLLDLLNRRGIQHSPELHQRRVALLASHPGATMNELQDAAEAAAHEYPRLGTVPYIAASQGLAEAGRAGEALAFIERTAVRIAPGDADVLLEWLRLTALHGAVEDARRLITLGHAAGTLPKLLARISGPGAAAEGGHDPRAQTAYIAGVLAAQSERDGAAMAFYELALSFDPMHAWASNNLGYSLLERDRELERAARLVETAFAAMPGDPSITDSLGWLRYKQAVLTDEADPQTGEVVREGAITLLRRAAESGQGAQNATILDHLGDALWAAGHERAAVETWRRARDGAQRDFADAARSAAAREEARVLLDSIGRKLDAAGAGAAPSIAPRAGEGAGSEEVSGSTGSSARGPGE